jgi:hypothetical protein
MTMGPKYVFGSGRQQLAKRMKMGRQLADHGFPSEVERFSLSGYATMRSVNNGVSRG